MNFPELQTLVAAGESATLELKKSTAEKDRACRTLCAFANGQGGAVVFGVTPAGKFVGQSVRDRTGLHSTGCWEALANAFIHRDYAQAAGSVAVALCDDRLEIIFPGELHFGLTPDSSIPELAELLGKSESAMERAIRKRRSEGRLQRVGAAKGGLLAGAIKCVASPALSMGYNAKIRTK